MPECGWHHSKGVPRLNVLHTSFVTNAGEWSKLRSRANGPRSLRGYYKHNYGGWVDEWVNDRGCEWVSERVHAYHTCVIVWVSKWVRGPMGLDSVNWSFPKNGQKEWRFTACDGDVLFILDVVIQLDGWFSLIRLLLSGCCIRAISMSPYF